MPTFDFRCQNCGHIFEFARPFGNKKLPPCPTCGSKKTEKIFSPPAVQFKGGGFYKTDSGSKQRKAAEKKETETKPAVKPESKPPEKTAPQSPSGSSSGASPDRKEGV